jgi:hypothetical protein
MRLLSNIDYISFILNIILQLYGTIIVTVIFPSPANIHLNLELIVQALSLAFCQVMYLHLCKSLYGMSLGRRSRHGRNSEDLRGVAVQGRALQDPPPLRTGHGGPGGPGDAGEVRHQQRSVPHSATNESSI